MAQLFVYCVTYVFIYLVCLSDFIAIGNTNNIQTEEKSIYDLNLWSFLKGNSVLRSLITIFKISIGGKFWNDHHFIF